MNDLSAIDKPSAKIDLKWFLSGLYSHLSNRSFSIYWQARSKHIIGGLDLKPEDQILEIGCGAGLWTSYMAPRVQLTTAIEIDPQILNFARSWKSPLKPYSPTANVKFVQASAISLPFDNASFTKILMADVVEHIPDDVGALKETARVLKPSGVFVLTTLLRDRPWYIKQMQFPDHVREYTSDGLLALLKDTGLVAKEVFYFYYAPTLVARELQVIVEQTPLRKPGVNLLPGALLHVLGSLESVLPAGRPAGVGLVAVKSR